MGLDGYTIVPAASSHVSALSGIERAAGTLFGTSAPQQVLSRTVPLPVLHAAQGAGRLWVALASNGEPVGFALAESADGRAHLEELDVVPEHGRRGVGSALVATVERWARSRGDHEITLTTYVDVPWNAEWYAGLGFEPIAERNLDGELLRRLEEDARGLERARRVAMCKLLPAVQQRHRADSAR